MSFTVRLEGTNGLVRVRYRPALSGWTSMGLFGFANSVHSMNARILRGQTVEVKVKNGDAEGAKDRRGREVYLPRRAQSSLRMWGKAERNGSRLHEAAGWRGGPEL